MQEFGRERRYKYWTTRGGQARGGTIIGRGINSSQDSNLPTQDNHARGYKRRQ